MTSQRHGPASSRPSSQVDPDPAAPPADPPDSPVASPTARRALRLGVGALATAGLGLVVAIVALAGSGGGSCRATAWNAAPAPADLPAGWTVGRTQVDPDGLGASLVGPVPAGDTTGTPTIYVAVSCYAADAAAALDRSRAAAEAAGQAVVARTDLGDGGYALEDATASTTLIQFRRGGLVASVAPSGAVDAADLEAGAQAVAAAMDRAVSGVAAAPASPASPAASATAGTSPIATAGTSPTAPATSGEPTAPATSAEPTPTEAAVASGSPEPSPAAPELLALLPDAIDGTPLTSGSAIGTDVLGNDTSGRAMIAALETLGKTPADLQLAQAYDETGTLDCYLVAFRIVGMPATELGPVIVSTWLSGSSPGVSTSTVTLGGRELTKVSYGADGPVSYVRASGEAVVVIATSDEALAGTVAALLP